MDERALAAVVHSAEVLFDDSDEDEEQLEEIFGSTSSSSDEEETLRAISVSSLRGRMEKRPRINGYVETVVPGYTAQEFKENFRLLPDTYEFLLGLVGPLLSEGKSTGRPQVPAHDQLLMAVWMMATPDSYRSVCARFNFGKATAIRTMRRIASALHSLAPRFITWPQGQRSVETAHEFERQSAFVGCIGAIDGTHIEIRAPKGDFHQAYVNRKGYNSIHVQAVCTYNLLFTSVYAGNAGSVHDARVFRLSPVAQYMDNPDIYFPNDTHIVGDAAYGIHPHIMVPFKDNGHLTPRQKNFNFCQSSARIAIERAFGLWKIRWRSVLDCLPMVKMEKIPEYLVATMVLHNICVLRGDLVEFDNRPDEIMVRGRLCADRREEGIHKRDRIMNLLPMRDN